MIVLLAKTEQPNAVDNVEAFCDAVMRGDLKTQDSLMSIEKISSTIGHAISELKPEHQETSRAYDTKVVKKWDDANASYCLVSVKLLNENETLDFTCRYVVNQWLIVGMQINSSRSGTQLS